MLVAKGRVALDRPTMTWVNDLVADERIRVVDLTPTVAVAAGELRDFHGDPADRLIVASAQARGLPLVTKDEAIRRSVTAVGGLAVIW